MLARPLTPILCLSLVLFVVGCGGSTSKSNDSTDAATVAKVNRLFVDAQDDVCKLSKTRDSTDSPAATLTSAYADSSKMDDEIADKLKEVSRDASGKLSKKLESLAAAYDAMSDYEQEFGNTATSNPQASQQASTALINTRDEIEDIEQDLNSLLGESAKVNFNVTYNVNDC